MTNKEKAEEICKRHIFDSNHFDCCIEMAEYKDDYYYKVITEIVGAAYNTCEDPAEIDTVLKKYNL